MVPRDPKDTAASVRQRLLNASRATEFLCPALGAARFSGRSLINSGSRAVYGSVHSIERTMVYGPMRYVDLF